MALNRPPVTDDMSLNAWMNDVTNTLLQPGANNPEVGAPAGTTDILFNKVVLYQAVDKGSVAPAAPAAFSVGLSGTGDITYDTPTGWSRTVPISFNDIYKAEAFAISRGTNPTVTTTPFSVSMHRPSPWDIVSTYAGGTTLSFEYANGTDTTSDPTSRSFEVYAQNARSGSDANVTVTITPATNVAHNDLGTASTTVTAGSGWTIDRGDVAGSDGNTKIQTFTLQHTGGSSSGAEIVFRVYYTLA